MTLFGQWRHRVVICVHPAGILAHLKDAVTIKTEQPRPVDISGECCAMLERLMLAQAQEVFYEISSLKKMSASVCARIAKQVSLMYYEVTILPSLLALLLYHQADVSHASEREALRVVPRITHVTRNNRMLYLQGKKLMFLCLG